MDIGVDTWVSLASGKYVLAHGAPIADPFSFNSRAPSAPNPEDGAFKGVMRWLIPDGWIDQAWLTHALFALVERSAGLGALVSLKYVNYALIAGLLLLTARARRADPTPAFAATAIALLAGRSFFEVRPQDATNLLAAGLMLLLAVLPTRSPRVAWWLVPLFAFWGNVHGGFVWGLMALAIYLGASWLSPRVGGRALAVSHATLKSVTYAAAASLAAVVVLSPYRVANLTHPLLVSVGPSSGEWRNVLEWLPLSDAGGGEQGMFAVWALLLVAAAVVCSWPSSAPRPRGRGELRDSALVADSTHSLDLGATGIVALTLAMAVVSRRFLPMAYLVGAPLLAQWLTGVREKLASAPAPWARALDRDPIVGLRGLTVPVAWALALGAAVAYAVPFARTFFGPWPFDERRSSFADRALQTVGQPWDASEFVRLNGVSGRMWNYWEAGGFWEWRQDVDPTTGRTPVQVFIDGRAQVAYSIEARRLFDLFDAGGPLGIRLDGARREPSPQEAEQIRSWVGTSLHESQIWLAHMMERQASSRLAIALFSLPQWQPVFQDQYDTLLADTSTPEGAALAAAVDAGEARFPSELSRLLTLSYRALAGGGGGAARALELAREAYALQPSARPVNLATGAAQDPAVAPAVVAFCHHVVDDAVVHHVEIVRSSGGYQRFVAAVTATRFLQATAQAAGDEAARRQATDTLRWLAQQANALVAASEW